MRVDHRRRQLGAAQRRGDGHLEAADLESQPPDDLTEAECLLGSEGPDQNSRSGTAGRRSGGGP